IAAAAGVALSGLQRRGPALEEVFLDLVNGTRVYTPAETPVMTEEDISPDEQVTTEERGELR
ncbi:MAG: hypothetical protein J0H70_14210, partial [Microbacterium chocolatum]|nr:hypothetical protein [Microbacterium chocolatum]